MLTVKAGTGRVAWAGALSDKGDMVCHGVSWCVRLVLFFVSHGVARCGHGVSLLSCFWRKKTWCGHGAAMVCHGVPLFSCFCRKTHGVAMVWPWCAVVSHVVSVVCCLEPNYM